MLKRIIWAKLSKNHRTFYPKSSQKYGFGIKKAPDPGSGSATLSETLLNEVRKLNVFFSF
jgi:hypothetical protein